MFHKKGHEPGAKVKPPPCPSDGEGTALTDPWYLSRISLSQKPKHPVIIKEGEVQSQLRRIRQQFRFTGERDNCNCSITQGRNKYPGRL